MFTRSIPFYALPCLSCSTMLYHGGGIHNFAWWIAPFT